LGIGLGDRLEVFRGDPGLFEGGMRLAVEAASGQENGKEGVDGSSPSEGFAKLLLISPF